MGLSVLTDVAKVLYKTTDYWAPEHERCIAWHDRTIERGPDLGKSAGLGRSG
jgi:dTDP-4-dehydrorhamnose 3,5-epimerase